MEILQETITEIKVLENGAIEIVKQLFVQEDGKIVQKKWAGAVMPDERGEIDLKTMVGEEKAKGLIALHWTPEVKAAWAEKAL